jgi:hypothetical protein
VTKQLVNYLSVQNLDQTLFELKNSQKTVNESTNKNFAATGFPF